MTLSYAEQLKHPKWQRLRLERLDAAGWKCEACSDAESTLHVHHKRYIKGRLAWEYPADNFSVLCERCHAEAHGTMERMQALLALLDHRLVSVSIPFLAGFMGGGPLSIEDEVAFSEFDYYASNLGHAARSMGRAKLNIFEVCEFAGLLEDPEFVEELRAAMKAATARMAR